MIEINGKSVYNASAMGKLHFYHKKEKSIIRKHTEASENEKSRFLEAIKVAAGELEALYKKALSEVGESNAEIFKIHQLMLEDKDFQDNIINIINSQKTNAEYAVAKTSDIFSTMFENMEDDYMRARSTDIKDISNRIIRILSNEAEDIAAFSEPYIIVANDLTPSETVRLDKEKLLGIVIFGGSLTSHTAILARTMNIPAIINAESLDKKYEGETAIIDGYSGTVYITPDENTIEAYKERKKLDEERRKRLEALKGKPNISKSGKSILVYANIGRTEDAVSAVANDAGGIGLFRSEFLYLESKSFPTEDTQFYAYKSVLEKMGSKRVIIRTLDIGADKKIDYFKLPEEENPALGYRAIRFCLKNKDVFKTQLKALFRASVYGNLAIMLPMITSLNEVLMTKELINYVKKELKNDGIAFKDNIEIGIMIETPAAAIISDILAKEVDFFSLGTNDLTQYILAADRQNGAVQDYYNTHHEAVLRIIEYVADIAHKNGIWIGICGELASDLTLTELFLKYGIDELSVSPSYVLQLREKIINAE